MMFFICWIKIKTFQIQIFFFRKIVFFSFNEVFNFESKNLIFLNEQHITDFLQVFFSIVESFLKIKHTNVFNDLNNFTIKSILSLKSDISDVFSVNICFLKWLYFIIIEENLISDFSAKFISQSEYVIKIRIDYSDR